jgi:hypothetical protein
MNKHLIVTEEEFALLCNIVNSPAFQVPAPLARTVAALQDKLEKLKEQNG